MQLNIHVAFSKYILIQIVLTIAIRNFNLMID